MDTSRAAGTEPLEEGDVKTLVATILAPRNAIAFQPTLMTVENARIVGDRLYILIVIGDGDGEATMRALSVGDGPGMD